MVFKMRLISIVFLVTILTLPSCQNDKKTEASDSGSPELKNVSVDMLELLSPAKTGVDFNNRITEDNERNYIHDEYMYNGAGVATADINNDGLLDLFFTGNQVQNRLYLNKGKLAFEDITKSAGVGGSGWHTGVAIADVNHDGYVDIYVCRANTQEKNPANRENLLFINNKDNTFTESAKQMGVADAGYSLNAAFFDFDLDGDLDLFVTNYPPKFDLKLKEVLAGKNETDQNALDHLYQNDGEGHFTEISARMGVNNFGHGLGLSVSDINKDGYPDIFVANDYVTEDFLYINQAGKGFQQQIKNFMKHASLFSMGCDVADINNDGHPDIAVADMNPADNYRSKASMPSMNPEAFYNSVSQGIHAQYMRNALHLNSDIGIFAEIGQLAGVDKTDWSWSMLFGDLDNDGFQDLMVTNGLRRDVDEKDVNKKILKLQKEKGGALPWEEIDQIMRATKLQNYVYANKNGMQFENASNTWGFKEKAFSNGAAMADLDNDGDLDIVINNVDDPAFIFKNNATDKFNHNYLRIRLEGKPKNSLGYGTKITAMVGGRQLYREMQPERGYLSASDPNIHFGLGRANEVEELTIKWNDGRQQVLRNVPANQTLTVEYKDAQPGGLSTPSNPNTIFRSVSEFTNLDFLHKENIYDDFKNQVLLPHRMSQFGPALAMADVNGDGKEDVYVGGANGQASVLYIQGERASFTKNQSQPWSQDSDQEDVAASFLDIDNDGDQDLYVGSGGFEKVEGDVYYRDRLYINQGNGNFVKSSGLIPDIRSSASCVRAIDFDQDGDQDLFVGARVVPDKYPYAPDNFILQNTNGKLVDVTDKIAPGLKNIGMVSDALWTDINGDQNLELIVVGEWSPIHVFSWKNGGFENITASLGLDKWKGWWNCVIHADLDKDGDLDYVVGNLGLNYKYKATSQEPFDVYCDDFDKNGTYDIILGYYQNGVHFPVRGLQCSSEQMPFVKKEFPHYEEFGKATLSEIYGERLATALHLDVNTFESVILWNENGQFEVQSLPIEAQVSPVNGVIAADFTKDGIPDLLMAGNLLVSEVETGAADAGIGVLLKGEGNKKFSFVSPGQSGFIAPNDVKKIALLNARTQLPVVLVANNNEAIQSYGF
jgi:hypothetical protein